MQIEEHYKMPLIRGEEEEEDDENAYASNSIGFTSSDKTSTVNKDDPRVEAFAEALNNLMKERQVILDNEKLSSKEKINLLEANRKMLFTIKGGRIVKSDQIVFAILIFGAVVLLALALLTTYADLPHEVTLAFVGTVLGGTIATISQKLGKL